MKREIAGILLALWAGIAVQAAMRTPQEALRIAGDFAVRRGLNRAPGKNPLTQDPSYIVSETGTYIAVNTPEGFVLVGADDRLPEVLGYSYHGVFDPEGMPPAMRFLIQCYAEEMELSGSAAQAVQAPARTAVPPLMTSIWNQNSPFNDLAPQYNTSGSRAAAGCVATAMAQIMYYYRYPATGTGSHSYPWVCTAEPSLSKTLSADFGATAYDWANMLDSYKTYYSPTQGTAVATLLYHCGVAVNMGYGASSGAYTHEVPVALKTYFGYDPNYQRIQKIMYSPDSLSAIVYTEMAAGRPVIISGQNDEGGHAFVCDGADNRGYFHINWGWGGSNDGYYLLTALNPGKEQGIGGTTKGYNQSTSFFIGLQPQGAATSPAVPQLGAESLSVSKESFARSSSFDASINKLQNFGLTDFTGYYGIGLYDEDETHLVAVLAQSSSYTLRSGYYRTTAATLSSVKIPGTVPAGTYHICAIYKNSTYDWMRLMCTQDDYYFTITLTSSQATFYPNNAEPELTLASPVSFGEGVNTDSIPMTGAPVSFSIRNAGGTFRGQISARIYKGSFSKGLYEIMDSVVIRRNETLSSALQQKFDPNLLLNTEYKMRICWRKDANDAWHDLTPSESNSIPFKLYDPEFHLSLVATPGFDDNSHVSCDDATFSYSIANTGAPFDGDLRLYFYMGVYSRGQSDIQTVHIGTGETLHGAFSGPLEQPAGDYTVYLRYRPVDGDWENFIDVYGKNVGQVSATIVAPEPLSTGLSDTICADQSAYEGYGFSLAADDLPLPGSDSTYTLVIGLVGTCRDSIVSLTLSVLPNDTLDQEPVSVYSSQLPFAIDDYYTIPADAAIGMHEQVVPTGDCLSRRYIFTVYDGTPTPLTALPAPATGHSVLLMRLGSYDLYLTTGSEGDHIRYNKVFVPTR